MSTKSKGRSRLAIRYFDDRVLLTDTHAWAYYRVPSVSYEFTTPEEREALATNITVALAAIRMQDAEVHLRIAHRPYPAVEWATGLDATSDGGPGWREYLEQIYQHVWAKDFWSKEIYLGVRLGQRGDARAAFRRGVRALPAHLPRHRAHRWASRTSRCPRARSASGPNRPNGSAGHSPPARSPRGTRPPARSPGCSGTR